MQYDNIFFPSQRKKTWIEVSCRYRESTTVTALGALVKIVIMIILKLIIWINNWWLFNKKKLLCKKKLNIIQI